MMQTQTKHEFRIEVLHESDTDAGQLHLRFRLRTHCYQRRQTAFDWRRDHSPALPILGLLSNPHATLYGECIVFTSAQCYTAMPGCVVFMKHTSQ